MSKIKDVRGEVYNRFTIIENLPSIKYGKSNYKRVRALCQCGNERDLCYRDLTKGRAKSCGCINAENKTKVAEGDIYSLWTVIKETEGYFDRKGEKTDRTFLCKCVCGNERDVNLQSLKQGSSKSCGCQGIIREEKVIKEKTVPQNTEEEQWKESISYPGYYISTIGRLFNYKKQYIFPKKNNYTITINSVEKGFPIVEEMYKTFIGNYDKNIYVLRYKEITLNSIEIRHKETEDKIRKVYTAMKSRCYNPNATSYERYGGRGIKIDESFSTFEKFYCWSIINNFELGKGLQIDRINNDGNYSAYNCRWVIQAENNRNMSRNVMTWELVEKIRNGEWKDKSVHEISSIVGCGVETIKGVKAFKTWVA